MADQARKRCQSGRETELGEAEKKRRGVDDKEVEKERKPEDKGVEKRSKTDDKEVEKKRKPEDKGVEKRSKTDDKEVEKNRKPEDKRVEKRSKTDDKEVEKKRKPEDKGVEKRSKTDDKEVEKKRQPEDKGVEKRSKTDDKEVEKKRKPEDKGVEKRSKTDDEVEKKRKPEDKEVEEERTTDKDVEEECIGPNPAEAVQTKKRKVLQFESLYLDNLPSATMYEHSYMHRDIITHVVITKTDFIITASQDGHVKFWKKKEDEGVEFVKHFRSHLGIIEGVATSSEGALFCSIGDDKAMKIFDVVNFDMINMIKLGYHPGCCEWIYSPGEAICAVACSEKTSGQIFVYDGRGSNQPINKLDKVHSHPLSLIRFNPIFKVVVSADRTGMLEYWTGPLHDFRFPGNVSWKYKTDTDLYEFARHKTYPSGLAFSPDGRRMAMIAADRRVRVFRFLTGKLIRVFDESLKMFTELQQMKQQLPDMEFGRRIATEREIDKVDAARFTNIIFDETGHFVLYGTMLGVKVVNVETNR
uniref:peptidylprolyl isomerase domain and WD repeat-containing protein 1-like n=1 Tax=Myxine glutinosa TaxID=7769 RepID=UPI00358DE951